MKRLALLLAVPVLLATGCGESYRTVEGSEPDQVIVRDEGDEVDSSNLREACKLLDKKVVRVQWAGDNHVIALVTCE